MDRIKFVGGIAVRQLANISSDSEENRLPEGLQYDYNYKLYFDNGSKYQVLTLTKVYDEYVYLDVLSKLEERNKIKFDILPTQDIFIDNKMLLSILAGTLEEDYSILFEEDFNDLSKIFKINFRLNNGLVESIDLVDINTSSFEFVEDYIPNSIKIIEGTRFIINNIKSFIGGISYYDINHSFCSDILYTENTDSLDIPDWVSYECYKANGFSDSEKRAIGMTIDGDIIVFNDGSGLCFNNGFMEYKNRVNYSKIKYFKNHIVINIEYLLLRVSDRELELFSSKDLSIFGNLEFEDFEESYNVYISLGQNIFKDFGSSEEYTRVFCDVSLMRHIERSRESSTSLKVYKSDSLFDYSEELRITRYSEVI